MSSEKAEAFALQVLADGEQFRRRNRNEVALDGELHVVHTDYTPGGVDKIFCQHCKKWIHVRGTPLENGTMVKCLNCGDITAIMFH
jgi:hypothetical protein